MFLASRISGFPIQLRTPPTTSIQLPVVLPPPPDMVNIGQIDDQKVATANRILNEATTISALSERLARMDLSAIGRVDLIGLETVATRLRRDLSSTVEHRNWHTTQAHR